MWHFKFRPSKSCGEAWLYLSLWIDLMFYKYLNKVFIKIKNGIEPLY